MQVITSLSFLAPECLLARMFKGRLGPSLSAEPDDSQLRKAPTGSDDEGLGKFMSSDFGPLREGACTCRAGFVLQTAGEWGAGGNFCLRSMLRVSPP